MILLEARIAFESVDDLSFESMLKVKISYIICSAWTHKYVTFSDSAKRLICLRTTSSQRN